MGQDPMGSSSAVRSSTHFFTGGVYTLWQVLQGLVHQPFPGQAPIGR